jgi:hypothetical protein
MDVAMKRALFFACLAACNGLTGVGKYDVNDCPNGACSDAGASSDGGSDDGANGADAASDAPACAAGSAPVTVTVVATAASAVIDRQSGKTLAPGTSLSYCGTPSDQYRLESVTGASLNWSGVTCKDGPFAQRCEFNLAPPLGANVTAQ